MRVKGSNPLKSKNAESATYRGYVLVLLFLVYTFNFLDRQILSVLAIPIQQELDLTDEQLGLLGGIAFAALYSTLGVPLAWLADRVNRTWVITGALTIWSGFTALSGFAQNFVHLFAARVGVGVGEAGGVAPSYTVIADYFPPQQRSRALAIYSLGIPLGSAFGVIAGASIAGGAISADMDWRTAFIIVGVAGLILAPIFKLTVREPQRGRFETTAADGSAPVAPEPRKEPFSNGKTAWLAAGWALILASPSLLAIADMSFFGGVKAHTFNVLWMAALAGAASGAALGVLLGRAPRWSVAILPALALFIAPGVVTWVFGDMLSGNGGIGLDARDWAWLIGRGVLAFILIGSFYLVRPVVEMALGKPSFWLMVAGASASSMMGYGVLFWMPSFLARTYQLDLITTGWIFGGVLFVAGSIGLFAGGAISDWMGSKSRSRYAIVPAIAFILIAPFYWFGVLAPTAAIAMAVLFLPTALSLSWLGPVLSAFQHIAPWHQRASATSIFLLVNNLLGIGGGVYVLGRISTALAPVHGEVEALRLSIQGGATLYIVAAAFFLLASRYLSGDWEEDAPSPTTNDGPDGGSAEGEAFEAGFFTNADGLKIEYRDYPPVGAVSGPPVLCLHGLTRNVRDFETVAPRLAAMGRRVICASQRGRSRSDHDPQTDRYNPAVYTNDMIGLLDHLGIEKALFIGTSMGGLMTMLAAATAPDRLAGAVINDIGPVLDETGLNRIRDYVGKFGEPASSWSEAAERCKTINGPAFPDHDDEFWMAFARRVFREEAADRIVLDYDPAIGRMVAEDSSDLADLWPLFEALKPVPTLLVRGEISDLLELSTVEDMRRRKPDLEFVQAAGIGHAPFLDEADTAPVLDAFVKRIR